MLLGGESGLCCYLPWQVWAVQSYAMGSESMLGIKTESNVLV